MEKIKIKSIFLREEVETVHIRHLYYQIDWSDRLVGILGARGTGKTTLLLQRLKLHFPDDDTALYISLDDIYFASNSLIALVETFRLRGGKILFVDEVHKYNGWAREIKNIYDTYKDIYIVFTGSSVIDIYQQEADLSRRAVFYELTGLSFREYLRFSDVYAAETIGLSDILDHHTQIALKLGKAFKPIPHFEAYLDHGYYPFFKENLRTYFLRIEQVIRLIVETELRFVDGFDINNSNKVMQLLAILAENVPFKPNISKLSNKIGISRQTVTQYLHYLEKARLINLLNAAGASISTLQKPEKVYLENPNLHRAIASGEANQGSRRESFLLNQLRNAKHEVSLPATGDFLVDRKITIEVGGKAKGRKQIEEVENAFIAADDLEVGVENKIPLWLFGFLY
ncbi:ATP-binding protein [Sphingobacterium sp. DN00404]|uniref:ATP-binding protein n=1 Tax=Sphingobacterium micropteri TaxID=2763501 RepID=A0ABR7YS41_9SPHI|nr:AAA family ATPase [Sphingobacterium micropteri]MBD1434156.1 ATP-binding protein [Sphingobacterium micropteri]